MLTSDCPAFVTDPGGTIISLSESLTRMLGLEPGEGLNRPCWEVLACRDCAGLPHDPEGCPIRQAVRSGTHATTVLTIGGAGGASLTVRATAVCFQRPIESVFILVEDSAAAVTGERQSQEPGEKRAPAPGLDLQAVLERVVEDTGADAGEIFLTAPAGPDVVLAAQAGQAVRAFRERTRFKRGEGFPGLVAESGRSLVCTDLAADRRYLRRSVLAKGFRSYLCVPVWGREYLGSLHVAFRHEVERVDHLLGILAEASRSLGFALELARASAAQPLRSATPAAPERESTPRRDLAEQVLEKLVALSSASGGMLLTTDDAGQIVLEAERDMPQGARRSVASGIAGADCQALAGQDCRIADGVCLGARPICKAVARGLDAMVCVPVGEHSVAVLGYDRGETLPSARLSLLHDALSEAGALLDTTVSVEAPVLDIRCLGPFRINVGEAVISPEAFRRRHSLKLLRILVLREGLPVHRDELTAWLWPDSPAERRRPLLDTAVHCLRRALASPGRRPVSRILVEENSYRFDPDTPHRLDIRDFRDAAAAGVRLARAGRIEEAIAAYRRASGLYAGDLLEGELEEDWFARDRANLRELWLAVRCNGAELLLTLGRSEEASEWYRQANETVPARELIHGGLTCGWPRKGGSPDGSRP